jgi:Tol biopolymer transport system component
MKMLVASGLLCAAVAGPVPVGDDSSRITVVAQRARSHVGPATVDVSADGRFVAFESSAALVPDDRNSGADIYVLDRVSGAVTLESVTVDGCAAIGSEHARLSRDGRYVVYSTIVGGVLGSTHGIVPHVVLRDRHTGTTTLVSRTRAGRPASRRSGHADISDDGRTVVFESADTDLVDTGDRNGLGSAVYVFDVGSQTIERVSVDANGEQPAEGSSFAPVLSGNGRYVAFVSSAPLERRPRQQSGRSAEGARQVYVRDLENGILRRISRAPDGGEADGPSYHPAVSGDGRMVAFASMARNLGPRDKNRVADVYVHDTHTRQTTLVSRSARGGSAAGTSRHPAVSADGRFVAFVSDASDLVCAARCPLHLADLNLVADVYVLDTRTRGMVRVSGARGAAEPWWEMSVGPALDATGEVVAFSSLHAIDSADVGHDFDLFIAAIPRLESRLSDVTRRR